MSEYRGGLLGPLSKLFKRALKCESSSEANKLVHEWNEYIKYLNKLTTTGLPTHCPNCHREMEQ